MKPAEDKPPSSSESQNPGGRAPVCANAPRPGETKDFAEALGRLIAMALAEEDRVRSISVGVAVSTGPYAMDDMARD